MSVAPGQTVGPFFHLGLPYDGGNDLVPPGRPGAIRLHGRVLDGDGAPVPDALIEIWQADPDGNVVRAPGGALHRDGWTFSGFGRAATDSDGHYWFTTVEPGPVEPGRPPFFAVTVFARGLLDRLFTRAYLPAPQGPRFSAPSVGPGAGSSTAPQGPGFSAPSVGPGAGSSTAPQVFGPDPVLDSVPADRRDTLIAGRDAQGLVFDIRLQGEGETVFLSFPRQRGIWA